MQCEIDMIRMLDAFVHGLRLPPCRILWIMQIGGERWIVILPSVWFRRIHVNYYVLGLIPQVVFCYLILNTNYMIYDVYLFLFFFWNFMFILF